MVGGGWLVVACLWSAIECELSSFYQIFQLRTSFPFIVEDLLSLLFFSYSFYFLSLFFCKYFLSSCRTLKKKLFLSSFSLHISICRFFPCSLSLFSFFSRISYSVCIFLFSFFLSLFISYSLHI